MVQDPLVDRIQPILDREQREVVPDLRPRLRHLLLPETLHPHPCVLEPKAPIRKLEHQVARRVRPSVFAHNVHQRAEVTERTHRLVPPRIRGHPVSHCAHDAAPRIARCMHRPCVVRVLGENKRMRLLPD